MWCFILVFFVWIVMGIIGAGFLFAYLQSYRPEIAQEEYFNDLITSIALAMVGPITFFIGIFFSIRFRGWWTFWRIN